MGRDSVESGSCMSGEEFASIALLAVAALSSWGGLTGVESVEDGRCEGGFPLGLAEMLLSTSESCRVVVDSTTIFSTTVVFVPTSTTAPYSRYCPYEELRTCDTKYDSKFQVALYRGRARGKA